MSISILLAIILALVISLYNQPVLESPYHYHNRTTDLQAMSPYGYVYNTSTGSGTYYYVYSTEGGVNYTHAYYTADSGTTWIQTANTTFELDPGDVLNVTYSGWIE